MKLLALAVAATIAMSGSASAATFYFQETTGTNTVSFSLDTANEKSISLGYDYGQTAVTSGSTVSNVDVQTFLGFYIGGTPAFQFSQPGLGAFTNHATGGESFNVGSFTGQGFDQAPATLQISATPFSSAVSAAPEPGTWALLLGGIGMLGGMMRAAKARRREDELKSIATA